MRLDLDLSPELVLHSCLLELRLEQDLQRHDIFALLFSGQVDVPELSLSQGTADVKIVECPSVGGPSCRG